MNDFLLINHLKISNADAMGGIYTIGFPPVTAWLGLVHNLGRLTGLKFKETAIIYHDCFVHSYKDISGMYKISLSRMPICSNGKARPFIPRAKCDIDVSLLIKVDYDTSYACDSQETIEKIKKTLLRMKAFGGDIMSIGCDDKDDTPIKKYIFNDKNIMRIKRKLMPGYFLLERKDLLKENNFESFIKNLSVDFKYEDGKWIGSKKIKGYIVPLLAGYRAISDFKKVPNQRSYRYKHRFVEGILTLGEYKLVASHEFNNIFWHYKHQGDLYVCTTSD